VLLEEGDTLQRLFDRYLDGVEIVAARDADTAVRELGNSPAQALIVNTHDGARTLARVDRLGKLPYGTPTIACWIPGPEEAAERLGVVRYLIKPVTAQRLTSTLEEIGLNTGTILIVDDDEEALQLFTRMLSAPPHSYRIVQAATGQRALRLLRQRRPDVMMLDLIMPGVDGMEVLRRKNRDPDICDIPVVVVTSRDPGGEPIVSDTLAVSRSGGLSVSDLMACVRTLTETLAPSAQTVGQAQPGRPLALLASE
jgi:CheY-like chemotaxis protein